ncbi:SIMPL domain-containing protein [Polaribacter sp. Hel_I_88]|uniref:SIMPL domain-containing protein n=1 Tax=Polaribacter sp. Hel_I_88 TaxID=1250006 RepID=UPI00047954C7|nr:SIMPL domain-containing protein [Polaribacter sp. Hel_I_88]
MKHLKLIFFLLFTTAILAQSTTQKPFIEVTGTAEIEIVPNEIYLDISIKERTEKGKKLTLDFLENQLKTVLKSIGIPETNLSISDVNAVLAKTGWWTEEIFSVANYSLKVNGAGKLKQLFENFKKLEISDVHIVKATHSDLINIKKKNRIKAIKVAKEKADYLLNAIGEQTGKPIIINELANNNQDFTNVNYLNNRSNFSKIEVTGYGVKNKTVEFKMIKITSSIYVKFEIK